MSPHRSIGNYGGKIQQSTEEKEDAAFQGCALWFSAAGWPLVDFEDSTFKALDARISVLLLRVGAAAAGKSAGPVK